MKSFEIKRFNLNRDHAKTRLLSGIPVVGASILITVLLLILLANKSTAAEPPVMVDINRAPISQLIKLPGIGLTRAKEIIRYRQKRQFKRPSDILRIRGIGRRTYLKLRPLIRVAPPPTATPGT